MSRKMHFNITIDVKEISSRDLADCLPRQGSKVETRRRRRQEKAFSRKVQSASRQRNFNFNWLLRVALFSATDNTRIDYPHLLVRSY